MGTGRGYRIGLLAAAAVVMGAVGYLVLSGGEGPVDVDPLDASGRPSSSRTDARLDISRPSPVAPPTSTLSPRTEVDIVAFDAAGDPLPGLVFYEAKRTADGGEVFLDHGLFDGARTDAAGRLHLRWTRDRDEIVLAVDSDACEPAEVVGGTLLSVVGRSTYDGRLWGTEGRLRRAFVAVDRGEDPLLLTFRDLGMTCQVRLVDRVDGAPLDVGDCQQVFTLQGPHWPEFMGWLSPEPGRDGWTVLWDGPTRHRNFLRQFEKLPPPPLEELNVVVRLPGHAVKTIPLADLTGRLTVVLETQSPAAVGVVERTEGDEEEYDVSVDLWRVGGTGVHSGLRPRGLPSGLGPFALEDLEPGAWRLELRWRRMEGFRPEKEPRGFTMREFTTGGRPVDLGTLRPRVGGAVHVIVTGADGAAREGVAVDIRTVEEAELSTIRDPGQETATFTFSPGGDGERSSSGAVNAMVVGDHFYTDPARDPGPFGGDDFWLSEPDIVTDAAGEGEFAHLAPGRRYRALLRMTPWQFVDFTAPREAGGVVEVALRDDSRDVRCRLRFEVNGQVPWAWSELIHDGHMIHELDEEGRFEGVLSSGRRSIQVVPDRNRHGTGSGRTTILDIPDAEEYEATISITDER